MVPLWLFADSERNRKALYLFFGMQGFFFGVNLGKMVGWFLRKEEAMNNFLDVIAFIGYVCLAMYYLIYLFKHSPSIAATIGGYF